MTVHYMPTCETHGSPHKCPHGPATVSHIRLKASLDSLYRSNEGQMPEGYDGSEVEIETRLTLRDIGVTLVVAGVVMMVIGVVLLRSQGSL